MDSKKCLVLIHPNLVSGWGCCQCSFYNGIQRLHCQKCGHTFCGQIAVDVPERSSGVFHADGFHAFPKV